RRAASCRRAEVARARRGLRRRLASGPARFERNGNTHRTRIANQGREHDVGPVLQLADGRLCRLHALSESLLREPLPAAYAREGTAPLAPSVGRSGDLREIWIASRPLRIHLVEEIARVSLEAWRGRSFLRRASHPLLRRHDCELPS